MMLSGVMCSTRRNTTVDLEDQMLTEQQSILKTVTVDKDSACGVETSTVSRHGRRLNRTDVLSNNDTSRDSLNGMTVVHVT